MNESEKFNQGSFSCYADKTSGGHNFFFSTIWLVLYRWSLSHLPRWQVLPCLSPSFTFTWIFKSLIFEKLFSTLERQSLHQTFEDANRKDAILIANLPLPRVALIMLEIINWREGCWIRTGCSWLCEAPWIWKQLITLSPGPSAECDLCEASIGIIVHYLLKGAKGLKGPIAACDCGLRPGWWHLARVDSQQQPLWFPNCWWLHCPLQGIFNTSYEI